ncbi:MAG: T9SS type A sorting domain-containing protein [Cryomorphaceae bacterium]
MKQIVFSLFCIFSMPSFAQDAQWFELGTTWTFNHLMAFDSNQDEYLAEFEVTEITEFNGVTCSKVESTQGGLWCISVEPPYYFYESNDSIFYAVENMDHFELAFVFDGSDSWVFPFMYQEFSQEFLVSLSSSEIISVDGFSLKRQELNYSAIGEVYVDMLSELEVIEYVGALETFIIPFGTGGACDGACNIQLRCFSSPTFDYQNPEFSSCTLSSDEVQKERQVFFPNPAAENISWAEPIDQISLFDATGKLLLQKQINGEQSLSIEHLPSGFYTVIFQDGDTNFSQKLIIE